MNKKQFWAEAQKCALAAKELIMLGGEIPAEKVEERDKLIKAWKENEQRAIDLKEIEALAIKSVQEEKADNQLMRQFKGAGDFLTQCYLAGKKSYRGPVHPYFAAEFEDPGEKAASDNAWLAKGASERKDLVESVGASGGFLVPVEFRPELLSVAFENNPIRDRATIIPMRRRQVNIPTLDQTGGAPGTSAMFGGVVASWTEEAASKDETEPEFRQVELVAHKLVTYTETSDELIDDEAIGLIGFFNGPMGFAGAIRWEEEWTFLRGTGAGQPLGVLNANATIVVPRITTGQINPDDLFTMLSVHHGENGAWHVARSALPQILRLAGPAGNPSYIYITNARDRPAMQLFGMPLFTTEKLPSLDDPGDILLADWSFYLIGDRQAITMASSTDFRFRSDLTAWRAVHRVDGQPWLSQPLTLADEDGTQISPFVILGGGGS